MKTRTELLSLSARASGRPNINNLITWVKYYNQICIFLPWKKKSNVSHGDIFVSVIEIKKRKEEALECPFTC